MTVGAIGACQYIDSHAGSDTRTKHEDSYVIRNIRLPEKLHLKFSYRKLLFVQERLSWSPRVRNVRQKVFGSEFWLVFPAYVFIRALKNVRHLDWITCVVPCRLFFMGTRCQCVRFHGNMCLDWAVLESDLNTGPCTTFHPFTPSSLPLHFASFALAGMRLPMARSRSELMNLGSRAVHEKALESWMWWFDMAKGQIPLFKKSFGVLHPFLDINASLWQSIWKVFACLPVSNTAAWRREDELAPAPEALRDATNRGLRLQISAPKHRELKKCMVLRK